MLVINIVSLIIGIIIIVFSGIMMRRKWSPKAAIFVALFGLLLIIGPIVDPEASFPKFIFDLLMSKQ